MRSQTAQNITNLEGEVDARFSETLQTITSNSLNILDLRDNLTGLEEDVGLEIMSLNTSVIGLDQDISVKLDNLNLTQVRNSFLCSLKIIFHVD